MGDKEKAKRGFLGAALLQTRRKAIDAEEKRIRGKWENKEVKAGFVNGKLIQVYRDGAGSFRILTLPETREFLAFLFMERKI